VPRADASIAAEIVGDAGETSGALVDDAVGGVDAANVTLRSRLREPERDTAEIGLSVADDDGAVLRRTRTVAWFAVRGSPLTHPAYAPDEEPRTVPRVTALSVHLA